MACKSNCGLIPADIGQGKIGLACTEQYIAAPAPAAAPAGGSTAPGTQPGSMLGSDPNALAAGGRTDNRALPADDPNIVPWSGYNRGLPQSSTDYTGTQYGGNARSPYGNSAIQNGGNNGRYSQASDLNSSPYGQGNRFENMAFQSSPTDQTNAGIDRYGVPGNQRSSFESGLRAPQAESVDPSGYAQYYQDTANAGNSLANADQRRIEQSQGNDGVRQTDSSPSMGSGSSGIPDDTESPEGAKPLDTESPEGAKPADTESPEGAKPLDTESPEGAKPLDTESPEGAKPADTESPEGAKPPDTESPEGAEPVDTDSTEGAKPDADGEGSTPPTTNDDASPDASQDPIVPQTNGDDSQPTLPDGPANDDTSLTPSPISKTDYGGSADSTYGGFPGEKLSSTRTTPLSPREKFLANEAAKLRNVAAGAAAARQSVIAAAAASSEAATAAAAQKDAEDAAWKTQKDLEMSQIRDCSQKRKRKSLKFDKKACRKCCTKIDYLVSANCTQWSFGRPLVLVHVQPSRSVRPLLLTNYRSRNCSLALPTLLRSTSTTATKAAWIRRTPFKIEAASCTYSLSWRACLYHFRSFRVRANAHLLNLTTSLFSFVCSRAGGASGSGSVDGHIFVLLLYT